VKDSNRRISRRILKLLGLLPLIFFALLLGTQASTQKQTIKVKNSAPPGEETRSIYREYRSVQLGMTAKEVRAKLGEPKFGDAEMDFYVISETETTQIAYDKSLRVKIISTDYIDGLGAPDYVKVCGPELTKKPDGSLYQMQMYEKEGFWTSYNKSANGLVTVTIQILMK
jgi:hypothetical protein